MNRKVDWQGLNFEVELLDIQQLNNRLFAGDFDVAKTSFHAALLLTEDLIVLPSGSALGFGVGPLLLAAEDSSIPRDSSQVVLCPGEHTTASLLFRLFYHDTASMEQALFSDIMPRLKSKTADFGVCIHEGRFTYQVEGLHLVEDLGTRWESETRSPLPLGGLVVRRKLSREVQNAIQQVIHASIEYGLGNRDQTLPTMRQYAQEFNDSVLMQHVDLYVNEWTVDLGQIGRDALGELSRRAKSIGLNARPLDVL